MEDFNWVKARSECSLAAIFERLKEQLRKDIEQRQALLGGGIELVLNGESAAVVAKGYKVYDSVSFRLTDAAIEVADKDGKVLFSATPTVNDKGECRLKVNGQERELWHVRKMALEELFFWKFVSDIPRR